jgi:hypothetical protein
VSTTKSFAGSSFNLPLNREPKSSNWGTEVSNFLIALADYAIPKTGGSYTLSAELNLGATYGILLPYVKSAGTNIASAGVVRLAKTETIGWRNNANGADLALGIDSSNRLTFNSVVLATAGAASIVNADINAAAAIAYSKLAAMAAGSVLLGNSGNVATVTALSGDVTVDSSGVTAIGSAKVTNAMLAGSIAYSKLSLTGAILNADLAGSITYAKLSLSAGDIPYSKLTLTGAVTNADLAGSIAYSKLSLTGAILNADLAGSITYSKLSLSAGDIPYSKLTLTGAVTNADLAGSIAYSKLTLTSSIVNADVSASAAIAYSKLNLGTSIVNADINASAAIAYSKLNLASSIATADLASGLLVPLTKGGTGQTTANAALNALLPTQGSASGKVLSSNGTDTSWASVASSTQSQYTVDLGDSSNARTATNTNLLGDVAGTTQSATVTMTIAAPGVVTYTGHGRATYDKVYFTNSGGALPTGVSASTTYFITVVDVNSFKLSTTLANAIAGTFITTSGSQSGTHTCFAGGLAVADASATARGLVNTTTQTVAGAKTFSSAVTASAGVTFGNGGTNLNWYEEGTITPTYGGSSTTGTTGYATQTGKFVRIGSAVFFELNLSWTSATGTGDGIIGGLPYNAGANYYPASVRISNLTYSNGGIQAYVTASNNTITLESIPATGNNSPVATPVEATGTYIIAGWYRIS